MDSNSSKLHIYMPVVCLEKDVPYFKINPDISNRIKEISRNKRFEALHYNDTATEHVIQRSIEYVMDDQSKMDILVLLMPSRFHDAVRAHLKHTYPHCKIKDSATGRNLRYARFWEDDIEGVTIRFSDTIQQMLHYAKKTK